MTNAMGEAKPQKGHWRGFNGKKTRLLLSSLHDCMVNIKLKYNFVETPRKFIIAELSIRKLGSSSVLIIMRTLQLFYAL